jgi:hypothetical protein
VDAGEGTFIPDDLGAHVNGHLIPAEIFIPNVSFRIVSEDLLVDDLPHVRHILLR